MSTLPAFASMRGNDLELRVKAVPGARRDEIVGVLGDRLKVRVSQPPEGGRANEAIRELLAARLGVAVRSVTLVAGSSAPTKTFLVSGHFSELPDGAQGACAKLA